MLQINLDPEVIQKSLDEQTQKATKAAFESYAVESVIREQISNALIGDVLTEATIKAVEKIDVETLSQHLADQITRTAVATVSQMIEDSTINTIAKRRGYESYQDDYKSKMDALRAEIRSSAKRFRKIKEPS